MANLSQRELGLMLSRDYRLTTAEILYHKPDHPWFLQTYLWQELDIAPQYPILKKFLKFWEENLDGKLHTVTVVTQGIIKPSEYAFSHGEFFVH